MRYGRGRLRWGRMPAGARSCDLAGWRAHLPVGICVALWWHGRAAVFCLSGILCRLHSDTQLLIACIFEQICLSALRRIFVA